MKILSGWHTGEGFGFQIVFRNRTDDEPGSVCRVNLLVVEDEPRMLELLSRGLGEEGHVVMCAADGATGLELARVYHFDVIVLDIMMPKMDGFQMTRHMRAEKIKTPVLMLTAKDAVPDIVRGLDLGADDYLTKPFSFDELVARLRAVKRRLHQVGSPTLQVADLILDPAAHAVMRGGTAIPLSRTEYGILERLMFRSGKVCQRHMLIESVWGHDREIEDNTLDAFMHLLRTKIDRPGQPKLIHTLRGVGYMIREVARS